MEEIWKDIKGFEGLYQISNIGNVKSIDREILTSNGRFIKYKSRNLTPRIKESGYLYISIKGKEYLIHRLLGINFIPNPQNLPQVNHKDLNKLNINLENLEWVTHGDNLKHAYDNGARKPPIPMAGLFGDNNPKKKSVKQYDLCGNFIKEWNSIIQIQRELGVNQSSVISCCKGKLKTAGKFKWSYS